KGTYLKLRLTLSIILLCIFIIVGNIIAGLNTKHFNQTVSKLYKEKNVFVRGEINKVDLIKEKEISFYVKANLFSYRDTTIVDDFTFLCKLRIDPEGLNEFYGSVEPGNMIELKGTYTRGRERRNPGEFDYDKYLKSKGITGIVTINEASEYKIVDSSFSFFENTIFQVRKYIDYKIKTLHNQETAALLRGLLLADRREIDQETKTQFINSGVVHVLAVSGLHVGFIAFIFFFLFGRMNIYIRSILTITGLLCFMLITGVPPSVFRATVMAIVIILAFLTNRSTNIFNSLAIAALIILTLDPTEIYSPGFQLSFAAVFAIGAIYPQFSRLVNSMNIDNRFVKYLLLFLSVSLAAQIGTLPFVLIYFGKISVVGLLVNLVVIPAIGIIIALAITTILFSVLFPYLAIYYAALNDFMTEILLKIIAFSGNLSFSKIDIANYSTYDALIFYVFVIIVFSALENFKSLLAKAILIVLSLSSVFLFSSLDNESIFPENQLSVFMIDVGQGDAFLIKFPNGESALVDAGKASVYFDNGERIILPLLDYLGVEKIDYGFISHMDLDHYGGFISLISAGKIKSVYKPSLDSSSSKDVKFERYTSNHQLKTINYKMQSLKMGNCMIYVLNNDEQTKKLGLSSNDRSGILKIVYGETSFLFTGDAGKVVETMLIDRFSYFLNSDILKAGHHGSKTSTSNDFLDFVSPDYALISAGIQNSFGHPSQEVISELNERKINILRSDDRGGIMLVSNGENIKAEYLQ
ncbi:MAG: DNA internalization-related competence protein ComEC/Rec2, partial [Ignavibacteria bacterium]